MLRKDVFLNNYVYHIFNRGIDKRITFKDKADYSRFLISLENFNQLDRVNNTHRETSRSKKGGKTEVGSPPLVKIHNYCLMPNHYHLIVEQLVDNGISKFLQKVMTGYTMYFNKRYEKSGVVFQGRTKSKLVDNDNYFRWLKQYLALNPLDLCEPNWKSNGIKDRKNSLTFLKSYKYRSDFDYEEMDMEGFLKDLKEGNFLPF